MTRRWLWAWAAGMVFMGLVAGSWLGEQQPDRPNKEAFEGLTVSVLPFETAGAGAEQEYLARGIGADLRTDLARLPGLRLISASGDKAPAAARYVVSGSAQRDGALLRVNARLIDTRSSEQLWRQRFERPFEELLAVQDEMSLAVAERLPRTMSYVDRERLAKRYTSSAEAYDHFLRGQALFRMRQVQENRAARALFERAVDLDPRFARAYAALAMTYAMEHRYPVAPQASAPLRQALELAEAARALDPETPEAYWTIGFVHAQSRRHDLALKSLQQAIELNPSYADAYALMGGIYTYLGQPARSIPLLRTALRLNLEGASRYYLHLGRAHFFVEDVEQALINLVEAHRRDPEHLETRLLLAAALAAHGERDEAQWEAEQIRAQQPGFSARAWVETYPLTSQRHQARLLELLAKAGL